MPAKGLLPALLAGVSAMPANGLAEPPPPSPGPETQDAGMSQLWAYSPLLPPSTLSSAAKLLQVG